MSTYILQNNTLYHAGVKGMRWGVRRYQNPDGSLTELGKKRYSSDTTDDKQTKTINKTINKAVKNDLDSANTILREGGNAARTASNSVRNAHVKVARMDLSKMTDAEMRQRIAREQLESQYDSMFNEKRHRVESGKHTVAAILDGIGAASTITASALAIALAVKQLKGK